MVPFLWISLSILVCLGKCDRNHQQVRHEKTRYLTLGRHYYVGNETQSSAQGPRPLFRWDTPANEFSAAATVNYKGNISTARPTIWHARKRPYINRSKAAERARTRGQSVSFRKSYVYKAIPAEEVKPTPSKKVIYVVSRKNERQKGMRRRKMCKNPDKCRTGNEVMRRYKPRKWNHNEILRSHQTNSADHFPKGLIVDGLEELRKKNRRNKNQKGGDRRAQSGICLTIPEKCEQICTEEDGRAACSCYAGFMVVNGTKCVDVNECKTRNGGCDWKCVNTVGSRRCLCPDGYRLSADDKCIDVNECLLRNGHGPCQDTCINTMGGYYCTCDGLKGTVLARDNHSCMEVNDCNSGAAGCSHSCISTFGRSFCTCPDGYELGDDWKTCHDIDECKEQLEYSNRCEFGCVNTIGSYYCEMGNALSGG